MATSLPRGARRPSARLAIAAVALLAAAHGASADEGGLGDFFSSIFGAQSRPAPAPEAPSYAPAPRLRPHHPRPLVVRPLVVRLRPARPRLAVVQEAVKTGPVSIFQDRTLRRGDAVVTARGVRVFAGSSSWPYTEADFVSLSEARSLDRGTTKVLAEVDKAPRG